MQPLAREGVKGFKAFLCESGVEEFPGIDEAQILTAMKELDVRLRGLVPPLSCCARLTTGVTPRAQEAKSLFLFHAELDNLASQQHGHGDGHGHASAPDASAYSTFLESRPPSLEESAIDLIIRCASQFPSLRTHIVHLSAASALPALRRARNELHLPLTVETCFHYLTLSAEEIARGNTLFKCCPPIRASSNRDALWDALLRGDIDFVVSDHSPCVTELKRLDEGDFMGAWGGIGGLGLGLSLLWTEAKKRGVEMARVLEWVCERPAKQVGLEGRKGAIVVGADADLVVFDPEETFTVRLFATHARAHRRLQTDPVYALTLPRQIRKSELHFKNRASPYGAPPPSVPHSIP